MTSNYATVDEGFQICPQCGVEEIYEDETICPDCSHRNQLSRIKRKGSPEL